MKNRIALRLLSLAREVLAGTFTEEEWKTYQEKHPNAEKSDHTIVKTKEPSGEGEGDGEGEEEDAGYKERQKGRAKTKAEAEKKYDALDKGKQKKLDTFMEDGGWDVEGYKRSHDRLDSAVNRVQEKGLLPKGKKWNGEKLKDAVKEAQANAKGKDSDTQWEADELEERVDDFLKTEKDFSAVTKDLHQKYGLNHEELYELYLG